MNKDDTERGPIIAGAGLAGSLLAIFLARRGHQVRIIERNPDLRRHEAPAGRSINLALAERGIHALKSAGVFEQVEPLLIPMRGRMLHDLQGELKLQPYSRNPQEVIYSVSRAALTAALLDAAQQSGAVEVLFNHRITDFDSATGGLRVTTPLLDGALALQAAPLIAADGAGSVIRRALAGAGHITASEELLSHAYKELTIPPADDGSYRIDPHALHIWPRGGFMLIALPNPDCSFTVTLFMAAEGDPGLQQLDNAAAVRAFFTREFPDTLALIPDLEQTFLDNPTGVLGTVRCQPWHHQGNTLLLGDAAHAIVPFHGQGMNCAFEDCEVFDRLLEGQPALDEALFARFSALRKPNTDAIADMALENYVEMRDTVNDPRFHLQKALAWELEARLPAHFVPRYSMVMFRRIPYAEAYARGKRQAELLKSLTKDAASLEEIDLDSATRRARETLEPLEEPAD